jgi:NADPH-dependent curcumin reductase
VIASRHADFELGALVLLETGWQELQLSDGVGVRKLDAEIKPLSAHLGVLGMPGLTAWAGVQERLKVVAGETFVVSAAAGAVGSAAGQWARLAGARVVGIAGGAEKCRYVIEELGFAAAVDYKTADWPARLAAACPGGIDAYFDNVGPAVLEKVLDLLKPYGRVVLCGLPAQYSSGIPSTVPLTPIIVKRATLMGLVVYDFESRFAEFYETARAAFVAGQLTAREDRAAGLESAPAAFVKLMNGNNFGKSIVVVAEDCR